MLLWTGITVWGTGFILAWTAGSGLVDCWWKHFSCKMVTSRLPAAPKRSSTDSSCGDVVRLFQTNQKCFFKKRRRWINNTQMELICGQLLAGATDKTSQNIKKKKSHINFLFTLSTSCLRLSFSNAWMRVTRRRDDHHMKNQLLLTRWQTH